MPRPIREIVAQLRACIADGSITTTLIQTDDLAVLCDAAEAADDGGVSEKEKFWRYLERTLGPRD
jgi:hypothetical protein